VVKSNGIEMKKQDKTEEEIILCKECEGFSVAEDGVCVMCGVEKVDIEHDDTDTER
jgi:hypothetical protein